MKLSERSEAVGQSREACVIRELPTVSWEQGEAGPGGRGAPQPCLSTAAGRKRLGGPHALRWVGAASAWGVPSLGRVSASHWGVLTHVGALGFPHRTSLDGKHPSLLLVRSDRNGARVALEAVSG